MSREEKLARTLVELADTLVADFDVVELLTLSPTDASRCWMSPRPGSCWWHPRVTFG